MGRTLNPPTSAVREISTVVPVNKGGTGADNVVDAALNIGAIPKAYIGRAGGVGTLNNFGRIPASQLPASIVPEVTLSGSRSLYLSQVATFVISNYDANTTYTVSASSGTISRTGANITYTAPGVAGDYTITVNGRTVTVNVSAVRPTRPVLTSSTSGENSIASSAVMYVNGSAFSMQSGSGTHLSTDWEVYRDMALTSLLSTSLNDTVNKTSLQVSNLDLTSTYYVRARYRESSGSLSDWSTTLVVQTKDLYTLQLEEAKLTMPGTDSIGSSNEFLFLKAVALDSTGTRVAVGNWSGSPSSGGQANQGRVYIFRRSGSTWTLEQTLAASDFASMDYFGVSVAFDANATRVIVGAHNKTGSYAGQGAAYVFTRNTTTNVWTQEAKIANPSPTASNEYFGWSVCMSSDSTRCVVAAHGKSSSSGAAYSFTRAGSTWTLEATITPSSAEAASFFGVGMSMTPDGSRLAVGGYTYTAGATANAGAAWVFTRSGSVWTQEQKFWATDAAASSYFGGCISISADGTRVVVGAQQSTVNSLANAGAAYVFSRSGSVWTQEAKLTASNRQANDYFGSSVAISNSGNTIIVGAYRGDYGLQTDAGEVYIYTRNGTVWTEQKILVSSDSAAQRGFGTSAHMSNDGTRAAVVSGNRSASTFYFLAAYILTAS